LLHSGTFVSEVSEWTSRFAQDSTLAAELSTNPMQRETWLRLGLMWAAVAQQNDKGALEPPGLKDANEYPALRGLGA
jgi:hypothetical protein